MSLVDNRPARIISRSMRAKRTSRVRVIKTPRTLGKIDPRSLLRESPCRNRRLIPMSPIPHPSNSVLTVYDEEHVITYLRLLDADAKGADWREVARIVRHLDPEHESDRARRAFESHLSRAEWMAGHGYRHLLRGGASA
jgi:Uncharacterized conserved protein (DUF2285)